MKKNKKGEASGRKIISFFSKQEPDAVEAEYEQLEDLEREAEEAEKELQEDPELAGLCSPEEMYARIVAELKARGVWEEEESAKDGACREEQGLPEKEKCAELGRDAAKVCCDGKEQDAAENYCDSGEQNAAEKCCGGKGQDAAEQCCGVEEQNAAERCCGGEGQNAAENSGCDMDRSAAGEALSDSGAEEAGLSEQEKMNLPLSESEREALELGKKILRRREQRKRRIRRWKQKWKHCGITAAAVVIVFGLAMTCEASREFAGQVWKTVKTGFSYRLTLSGIEEENSGYTASEEETADMEKIQEALGILPVDFRYMPDGTKYVRCEIREQSQKATLFYQYNSRILSVIIEKEGSYGEDYYALDNAPNLVDRVVTDQEFSVEIWEVFEQEKECFYMATWQYDNSGYIVKGVKSLEEIKKIIKNMRIVN